MPYGHGKIQDSKKITQHAINLFRRKVTCIIHLGQNKKRKHIMGSRFGEHIWTTSPSKDWDQPISDFKNLPVEYTKVLLQSSSLVFTGKSTISYYFNMIVVSCPFQTKIDHVQHINMLVSSVFSKAKMYEGVLFTCINNIPTVVLKQAYPPCSETPL